MARLSPHRPAAVLSLAALVSALILIWTIGPGDRDDAADRLPGGGGATPASPATEGPSPLHARPAIAGPIPAADWQRALLPDWEHQVADWRAFQPERFRLRLDDGLTVAVRVTSVEAENGRTVLTARLEGDPADTALAGSFLVGTAVASDRWDALVVLTGLEYRIAVRAGSVQIEEAPSLAFPCVSETMVAEAAAPGDPVSAPEPASAGDNHAPLVVDVLFLYNEKALSERNGDTQTIDADSSNYIAASNQALENSTITNFRWRYLGIAAAPAYPDNDNTEVDLRAMRGEGAIASFVGTTQRAYGADQVVMLVGGAKSDAVGRAWLGGSVGHSVVNYPFPTFTNGTRSSTTTSFFTVCHELGHNFGCRHQRAEPDAGATDGNGLYQYGHTFPYLSGEMGTVMAVYVAPTLLYRAPYFSNPDLQYLGRTIGVPIDQPKAAHNTLMMRENAARMAALEVEVTLPVIVEQPRSQVASAGERVTIAVNATGGGLSYSWTKDGVAIPPQSASFSIVSASAATAGSYVVTVSNRLGSATSDPAVITVSSPVTPPPSATAGGGGGSGGGAAPVWLTAALLALHAAARRSRTPGT